MILKNKFKEGFSEGLRPNKTITVSEWADNYRILSQSSSAEPGKYSTDRTPFLREIMDCMSETHEAETIVFMKPAQIGGSEAMNNFVGYIVDVAPGPTMIVQPTVQMTSNYSKQRISPMIELSETLKSKMIDDNIQEKSFYGGLMVFVGANSAAGLRSLPIKYLLMDEVDAYPLDVDGEGDPVELARKRTTTFSRGKTVIPSTPTIGGISKVEKLFLEGDQCKYYMPCPFCGGEQYYDFYRLKFELNPNNDKECIPESVYYECMFCEGHIKEFQKTKMMAEGKWKPLNPNASKKTKSFHLNSLYSPVGWKSWFSLIDEHLKAKHDPFAMKVFKNTVLGETYKEKTHQPDFKKLYERREKYKFREASDKIVYVCAGADTQDDRLAYCILGFGEDNEIWVLAYNEIIGDPALNDVWKQFKREIERPIKHESGIELFVDECFIDSAGHKTDFVYDFCRKNRKYRPIVGRGDFGTYIKKGKTIDTDVAGNKFSDAIDLIHINTILTKKTVYNFLQNEEVGSRFVHFSDELPVQFFEMLTSEQMITKIIKGQMKEEFIKPTSQTRNEALDCFGYAYALAASKGINNVYGDEYKSIYKSNIESKKKIIQNKDLNENENVNNNVNKRPEGGFFSNNLSFNRR